MGGGPFFPHNIKNVSPSVNGEDVAKVTGDRKERPMVRGHRRVRWDVSGVDSALLHHESKGLSNTSFDFCQIGVTQLTGLIPHKRGIKGGEFCSHPGGA